MFIAYILIALSATGTAALGCWPAACILLALGVLVLFNEELRRGLRKKFCKPLKPISDR